MIDYGGGGDGLNQIYNMQRCWKYF